MPQKPKLNPPETNKIKIIDVEDIEKSMALSAGSCVTGATLLISTRSNLNIKRAYISF